MKIEKQQELSYLPYLDGWRGIAIIMVLIEHFVMSGTGGFGVSVFFVLSGFLMSRILFIQKVPLNIFYRRRIARILPAFWLYISVVFCCHLLLFKEFYLDEFLSTAFFLRSYFPENPSIFKSYVPIGHIWSLNVEEHCYILLSMLSLLATRFGGFYARIALVFCSFICVICYILYKYQPPSSQTLFILRTEVAALPLILSCAIYLWFTEYKFNIPSITPVSTFILALIFSLFSKSVFVSYIATSLLLAVSVNTLNFAPKFILEVLSNSVLRWFGICSYSIYLWQQFFYFYGKYAKDFYYYNIFALFMSLLLASVSFYFFEKPVRKFISGR